MVTAVCAFLARAIWIRRLSMRAATTRAQLTERTFTVSLILQLLALYLWSPLGARTAGRALHWTFGQWNLQTFVAHCLYLGALGLIGMTAASRLTVSDERLIAAFRKTFELPMTFVVPILLGLLTVSPSADREWLDMLNAPTDHWLDAYWTVLCAFMTVILTNTIRALLILRQDPRNRTTSTIYIAACAAAITACAIRVATAWLDINCWGGGCWYTICAAATAFAYAGGRSWRKKIDWLEGEKANL